MNGVAEQIQQELRQAGLTNIREDASGKLAAYLDLLLRWNNRLNLTAIREQEGIIQRHFIECLFVAQQLPADIDTLLDYGSGAGFPGMPIAIGRPEIQVTLAESQGKKASFLREAVRVCGTKSAVYEGRVEAIAPEVMFDAVTMRAVETMEVAIPVAARHATRYLALMITETSAAKCHASAPGWNWEKPLRLPNSQQMILSLGTRIEDVPRGTTSAGGAYAE